MYNISDIPDQLIIACELHTFLTNLLKIIIPVNSSFDIDCFIFKLHDSKKHNHHQK